MILRSWPWLRRDIMLTIRSDRECGADPLCVAEVLGARPFQCESRYDGITDVARQEMIVIERVGGWTYQMCIL
jgi:hypothetical protein